ncbi:hypothetical protein F5Y10DRAFT_263595 [Nemania abortiva]|nr:hypothetical protein F5Y10DRAFT_263595 [Nemania abortiva]
MHRYRIFITFIITLSAFFICALSTTTGTNKDTLNYPSSRNNDNPSSNLDSNTAEAVHGLGNESHHNQSRNDADNNNGYLEDNDDFGYELDPDDPIALDAPLNNTSSLSTNKRVLRVKDITCSGLTAGRNITGAVKEFVD